MTRNLYILATVAVFGLTAAGAGDTRTASACDDAAKSASATKSCCSKGGTNSASVDAKTIHGGVLKSAMIAPGASGSMVMNAAAFGATVAAGDCDWCPPEMCRSAAAAAAKGCPAYSGATACVEGGAKASAAMVHSGCTRDASATAVHADIAAGQAGEATTAGASGCPHAMSAVAAGHEGCSKSASAAGHAGCEKSAAAAAAGRCASGAKSAMAADKCSAATTASLKGVVDELPYRESKRVVLAGSYACGHCTLSKTEECAPMLKTADGKIYPLLKSHRASELRTAEGKGLEVTGVVKKVDGVKFLDVKSYKVL